MTDTDERRLNDIVAAIERIQRYAPENREGLDGDHRTQDAILHCFMIIGEAANNLSAELRAAHDDVPWKFMIGMRHVVVHGYMQIDLDMVWNTMQANLPEAVTQLRSILEQLGQ